MKTEAREIDVLVVGAGISGLIAAAELRAAGRNVVLVDKGRGVGGRVATRRIGAATFDHGAQFFTVRDPRFAIAVTHWASRGLVTRWFEGTGGLSRSHPRWRGTPTMTAVPKHLAERLQVTLQTEVRCLRRHADHWAAELQSGAEMTANAVVLTPPVPQALALLDDGGVEIDPEIRSEFESLTYERCLAVMALLDEPSGLPEPGGLEPGEGPVAWIADNQAKGVSGVPAVTVHASGDFSLRHWETDRNRAGEMLLEAAGKWIGSGVSEFQVHGWKYSKPTRQAAGKCRVVTQSPMLIFAGDAFGGARVEGAALSGWAAADALISGAMK